MRRNFFMMGFRGIMPVMTGVIPFGAVVGTVASEAGFSFAETVLMNVFVFAGAAQLAATEMMTKHTAAVVVVVTGLIINLRFLLYSAALSPILQRSNFFVKLACAYCLTDQNYAVMTAHQDKLKTNSDSLWFYSGASACMIFTWHASVVGGFIFGNFAPATWALDYAVPLSFVALVIPTLKSRNYIYVAAFSTLLSIALHPLPYRLGLIITALAAIALAALITRKRGYA